MRIFIKKFIFHQITIFLDKKAIIAPFKLGFFISAVSQLVIRSRNLERPGEDFFNLSE